MRNPATDFTLDYFERKNPNQQIYRKIDLADFPFFTLSSKSPFTPFPAAWLL